jgi:hypothetical protein
MSFLGNRCCALLCLLALATLTGDATAAEPPPTPPESLPVPRREPSPAPPGLPVPPQAPPPWLPHYDIDMNLDLAGHQVFVHQRVTWTNRHQRPAEELVFNGHSHYTVPDDDVGLLAKTLEIMRMMPSDALTGNVPPLDIRKVCVGDLELHFEWQKDINTALVVHLPHPVTQGQTVVVDIDFVFHLPQKQGRWGQWEGVTTLSNWLPVLAYFDDLKGWQPTPFIPWHQPFFNESGIYCVRATLPCDQKIASSGFVVAERRLADGTKQVEISAPGVRDFAFLCSSRYCEFTQQCGATLVRCVAFPEHEHYARAALRTICEVFPYYSQWFGPYPWPELTFAESYFGWNGNECATLVMIDERVFNMPHLADGYVEYLIAHETCHQWWYNLIGTNGYCETWMDEAMANYFAHRFLTKKYGTKNNTLLTFPPGLEWLPNIKRQSYRYYGFYGTVGRNEQTRTLENMEDFKHVITLFSMAYDKGGTIVGMIEDRLGEAAFLDFNRIIYQRYQYRMLRVADYQHELEEYTGNKPLWEEFFHHWLYGAGLSDWSVEHVKVEPLGERGEEGHFLSALHREGPGACHVEVLLHQKAEINEQTVLGVCFDGGEGYQLRIPIIPAAGTMHLDDPPAYVEVLPDNRVRVQMTLPRCPTQIAVDPDQVLVDKDPSNNYWKTPVRWRITPLYTFIDETALTTDYDKWNIIAGPWAFGSAYDDPWYTRSTMLGARIGAYRTEYFAGGLYAAYRTDYRDIVAGVDALWDHTPLPNTQLGFNVEQRLVTFYDGENRALRATAFGRYVFQYTDSLYLPPMHYAEVFGNYQNDFLPFDRHGVPSRGPGPPTFLSERYDHETTAGLHYHIDYLTPYWDPEGGFRLDATYQGGVAKFDRDQATHQVSAQLSFVKSMPDLDGWLEGCAQLAGVAGPVLRWLSATRWAVRAYGAAAVPDRGEFFSLGGSEQFRGFDLRERQGSVVWVGSVEWRVPIIRRVEYDVCDHLVGVRNIYAAAFYDIGDAYIDSHSFGPVVHALGMGLRLDLAWLGVVERTTMRFDVAKTVNADTPWQFWFGFHHPF